jgi:hypothetical protein
MITGLCYLCNRPAHEICIICGRPACQDHIKNKICDSCRLKKL